MAAQSSLPLASERHINILAEAGCTPQASQPRGPAVVPRLRQQPHLHQALHRVEHGRVRRPRLRPQQLPRFPGVKVVGPGCARPAGKPARGARSNLCAAGVRNMQNLKFTGLTKNLGQL